MAINSFFSGATTGSQLTGGSTKAAGTLSATTKPIYDIQKSYAAPLFNSGGGGSTSTTLGNTTGGGAGVAQQAAPPPDPYAAWGGTAAYNSLVSGFNNQKSNIYDSANDAAANSGISLRNSILDYIDSLRTGQSSIDNRGINNELARQRGTSDVYSSMNRGIRSGGVTLANRNASDSSASDAIARAYGDIGRRQMSDIGNQYALEGQEIGLAQDDLNRQRASGMRRIESSEAQAVNSIVADANDRLSALDAAMANANLPERLALDAEKQKIRGQVRAVLDKYDNDLGRADEIKAMGLNARVAEATRRGALGQAPSAQFDYSTEAPMGLEGSGPFSSELPIFTYRNDEE
jgi:hypothetical protein